MTGANNGFVSKVIKYHGKAAHAAGSPQLGINALNVASIGLTALAYHRETFKDFDHVRIHPIVTKGGNLVNVVPDEVIIETLVRASNQDAFVDAAEKTDRSFFAGGAVIGASVEMETMPGYLPTLP
ncbi:MAG: peptidase dimerization domain-containing protein [Lachnospiraceae bacterium]|nr:peptidase dimerization domain-containing protein [Lachnospiraceae bacterium]